MRKHWNAKSSTAQSGRQSNNPVDELASLGIPTTIETSGYTGDASDCFLSLTETQPASIPGQDRTQATLDAILAILTATQPQPAPARRRLPPSQKRIEDSIRLLQRCGITPVGVVHRIDGGVEITLPGAVSAPPVRAKPKGWDI